MLQLILHDLHTGCARIELWIRVYTFHFMNVLGAGLGMNEPELARNPVLTEFTVRDLNDNPQLPYKDNSFDVVTNAVSVDYLNKPVEVFKEMHRVLKPGGRAIMSFSNRCFPTKGPFCKMKSFLQLLFQSNLGVEVRWGFINLVPSFVTTFQQAGGSPILCRGQIII